MDKIKFFIGTDVNGGCSECQMVLEYSIKKHCSVPYEIFWMKYDSHPYGFWHANTKYWSTPFSGFRYFIPQALNFQGKAIYQDDDQLWLDDPIKLWDIKVNNPYIMTGKMLPNGEVRHCVSLIDCEKFGDRIHIPLERRKMEDNFCDQMKMLTFPYTQIIDGNFNNYDGENEKIENIKVLHFTDMSTNPGVKLAIKRLGSQANHWYDGPIRPHRRKDVEDVFYKYYKEALDSGFKIENYVPKKYVKFIKQDQSNYKANNGFDVTLGE